MAFCRLVFPLLVLSVIQSFASVQVPVYLWGDLAKKSLKPNPLTTVSVDEFDNELTSELSDNPFTVIFIEETLSVEDFSRKNSDGDTSFPYLHANIGDAIYLPNVENPLRVLNKLADPEKVDHVKLTENGLSAEIEPESGKFLFINLKDAKEGESRSELLRRHNDFMEDMFTKLQERYDRVIAIYTAHYPSWTIPESHSRVRRQSEGQTNARDLSLEGLLLYYKSMVLDHNNDLQTLTGMSGSSMYLNETAGEMSTTLVFDKNNVTLNFFNRAGYWSFDTITLEQTGTSEDLVAKSEIYALNGFSYRCADTLNFTTVNVTSNARYTIVINDLKVQPFFTMNNTDLQFGESFNCVGFFSSPIWACLFVVFILLSITFYGIMMMMDIRTMDRFDDPKGKTITINAAE